MIRKAGPLGSTLRPARVDDLDALSQLAFRSKASWGYDDAFMTACRAELTFHADHLRGSFVYLHEGHGDEGHGGPLGFYRLEVSVPSAEVGAMFVAPEAMRQGIGRGLWQHLEQTARAAGVEEIRLDSDPHAERFYLAMGMRRQGEAPSLSIPGRMLPRMVKAL